jgi:hypothetical protein
MMNLIGELNMSNKLPYIGGDFSDSFTSACPTPRYMIVHTRKRRQSYERYNPFKRFNILKTVTLTNGFLISPRSAQPSPLALAEKASLQKEIYLVEIERLIARMINKL